jgi:hypothetical protein
LESGLDGDAESVVEFASELRLESAQRSVRGPEWA